MDLFLREAADRIGTDDALTKVDALDGLAGLWADPAAVSQAL